MNSFFSHSNELFSLCTLIIHQRFDFEYIDTTKERKEIEIHIQHMENIQDKNK